MDEADRIDSWKQIAGYLGKSERTVRRWQQVEGLPVHRHVHQQRGSVWAYKKEIDEWLASRQESPEPLVDAPDEPPPRVGRRVLAMGGTALGAAVLLTVLLWPRRTPVVSPVFEPEPLTALPGVAYAPTFSPDGGKVAFFWQREPSGGGIYVKTIGSDVVTLAVKQGEGYVYSPAWSPDGKTVAYLHRVFPGSRFAQHNTLSETWLCLVDAAGGPERRLMRLASGVLFYGNHRHLSWSLDSKRILAPMADGARRGVHWIPANGGGPRRLTEPPAEHHHAPLLSPDGRAFVYMRQSGPDSAALEYVYRQDLTSAGDPLGSPRLLSESRSLTSGLAWTPSGNELIVCRASSALVGPFDSRLYRMRADAPGDLAALGLGQCSSVAIARHEGGALLAYGSGDNHKCRLWRASLDAASTAEPFAPSSRFDAMPAYSPDGSLVAFVSNRTGKPEVWVAKSDGAEAKRLTTNSHVSSTPRWSPDGRRLVYGAGAPPVSKSNLSAHGLYVVPLAGGDPERVPLGMQAASDPEWTADGKLVQYWSGQQIWRVRPDGADAVVLGQFPATFMKSGMRAGRSLLYAKAAAPFEIRLAAGGEDRVVAAGILGPSFAATEKFVYFVKAADRSLYAQPLAGGAARRLRRVEGEGRLILGMTVSPDDASIVWAITEEPQMDLMLVRDFR